MLKRWGAFAAIVLGMSGGAGCGSETDNDLRAVPPLGPVKTSSTFAKEVRGGQLHQNGVASLTGARPMEAASLLPSVRPELQHALGTLAGDAFSLVDTRKVRSAARTGGELTHVGYRQQVNGVPIHGTYLNLTLRENGAGGARLVASSFHLYQQPRVETTPAFSRERAIGLARSGLRTSNTAAVVRSELQIRYLDGALQLVYDVGVRGKAERAIVIGSGPRAGAVVVVDDRVYETTGHVPGAYTSGGAPGKNGTVVTGGIPNVTVAGGGASSTTDAAGNYASSAADGTTLTATPAGRAATIFNTAGPTLSASGAAANGLELALGNAGSPEAVLAQVTAYKFVDETRSFLEANGVDPAELGASLPTNVNINDVCNAFYSPAEGTINFYASGGGCNNSAIDTVIAHEYGHFVDDHFGGIFDGGLSEGWGDLLACFVFKNPDIGKGIDDSGSLIRTCDNTYVYPPGGNDEVHNLGQAWAGFGWHTRQNLIAQLGEAEGDAVARALIIPSFATNTADIPASVREAFLRDDDDGDLTNQTPHWDALYAAALLHGLTFAIEADVIPPAQVLDLAAAQVSATTATLTWTAPGDDGNEGTAAAYDVRWSLSPIDESSFLAATPVAAPAPLPAGSLQAAAIPVPAGATIHVALRTSDEQGNTAPVSNDLTIVVPEGLIIFEDGAEDGLGGWTADGLWHVTERRASAGTRSFWYGDEATGNYDTLGTANTGTLVSPIIDLTAAHEPTLVLEQYLDIEAFAIYDLATIEVIDLDDAANVALFPKTTGFTGGFVPRVESLQAFAGHHIQLRFSFDTVDGLFNATEGWFLDRVRVIGAEGSTCAHPKCEVGGPLDPACDPCVAAVCALDSFCCNINWDGQCVAEVATICGETCPTCGNGTCDAGEDCSTCPGDCGTCTPDCAHDLCDPGLPLEPACSDCTTAVCAADPYCCTVEWDRICVESAEQTCGITCENTCAHPLCENGGPLEASCDPCVQTVCAADDYCCNNSWDRTCINAAVELCQLDCVDCAHDMCAAGAALDPTCDACAANVCAADAYCCQNEWDARCVETAANVCGLACGCSHEICQTGGALEGTCDPCVAQVCANDAYCCANAWDDRCVEEANATCGLACPVSLNPVRRGR